MWTTLEQLLSLLLCLLPFLVLLFFKDHLSLQNIRIIDIYSTFKFLFRRSTAQRRQEKGKMQRWRDNQTKETEEQDDEDGYEFELDGFYVDCDATLQSQYFFEELDTTSVGCHQRRPFDRRKIMRRKRHENRYRARRPMEDKITIIKVLND